MVVCWYNTNEPLFYAKIPDAQKGKQSLTQGGRMIGKTVSAIAGQVTI